MELRSIATITEKATTRNTTPNEPIVCALGRLSGVLTYFRLCCDVCFLSMTRELAKSDGCGSVEDWLALVCLAQAHWIPYRCFGMTGKRKEKIHLKLFQYCLHGNCRVLLSIYTYFYIKKNCDNIFHLDVRYVCMLVQRFEPQGRRFTNFHYYYYYYETDRYCYCYYYYIMLRPLLLLLFYYYYYYFLPRPLFFFLLLLLL